MDSNIKLTIGIIITLALATSGTYYLAQDDDAYYCESRNIVMICEKLSSGIGTRCYFENTYKKCDEGWQKIELDQEINTQVQPEVQPVPVSNGGVKWLCSPEGCVGIQ